METVDQLLFWKISGSFDKIFCRDERHHRLQVSKFVMIIKGKTRIKELFNGTLDDRMRKGSHYLATIKANYSKVKRCQTNKQSLNSHIIMHATQLNCGISPICYSYHILVALQSPTLKKNRWHFSLLLISHGPTTPINDSTPFSFICLWLLSIFKLTSFSSLVLITIYASNSFVFAAPDISNLLPSFSFTPSNNLIYLYAAPRPKHTT